MFRDLSLRHRGAGVTTATEHLILRLDDGEVMRAVCTATVPGFGAALLAATDQRLLGDGENGWTCVAPWIALDAAWPRFDRTNKHGEPEHELVVNGVVICLGGPLDYREAMIANAWRGVVESIHPINRPPHAPEDG